MHMQKHLQLNSDVNRMHQYVPCTANSTAQFVVMVPISQERL